METALTKAIKKRLRYFKPALDSKMRTVRWAEEVRTETGFVDVIRFEDYIEKDSTYCRKIAPMPHDLDNWVLRDSLDGTCKLLGYSFPNPECHGCVYKQNVHVLGILTTCFEVKITVNDFKSEHGHNFVGNRNYYVVPLEIFEKVLSLVPEGIGLLVYYPSGCILVKKECVHKTIGQETLVWLLYNAMKKWVDGQYVMERIS